MVEASLNFALVLICLHALPFLQDWLDIDSGIAERVSFVATSFVKSAKAINYLKSYITARCGDSDIAIRSKIDSVDSLKNTKEIIQASDGAMNTQHLLELASWCFDVFRGVCHGSIPRQNIEFTEKCQLENREVVKGGKMAGSNGASGHCIFIFREHLRGDLQLCRQNGVDFIATSSVKSAEVIDHLKSYITARSGDR
ncbi:hypothetical protein MKW92_025652 [Papaver armeniacum]|nr:hypothetical protein MKW92_025652 [Papaver armeniacum]